MHALGSRPLPPNCIPHPTGLLAPTGRIVTANRISKNRGLHVTHGHKAQAPHRCIVAKQGCSKGKAAKQEVRSDLEPLG